MRKRRFKRYSSTRRANEGRLKKEDSRDTVALARKGGRCVKRTRFKRYSSIRR